MVPFLTSKSVLISMVPFLLGNLGLLLPLLIMAHFFMSYK